ncbi:uncharacterized protein LOC126883591 [Diabrotica virgifera virgifera]|uniref:Uncharacterized protein n=1 Tax=Diabrotica virgifera virgifera TaxID=50390 RepID=A0ABM5K4T5_DIAVI|nr:uncharacterized protein LOC126883591 [Diabrotica virgifera virgifera]
MAQSPPIYEGSRKVGSNLFQELSSDTDDCSSMDENGFKKPRSERKKEKSKKKKEEKSKNDAEAKKDGENPIAEPMYDEAEQAVRGTTKRAKPKESEADENKKEKVLKTNEQEEMRKMLEAMTTERDQQRAENEKLRIVIQEQKEEMKKMSAQLNNLGARYKQNTIKDTPRKASYERKS